MKNFYDLKNLTLFKQHDHFSVVYGQFVLQYHNKVRADLPRMWEPPRRVCLLVVTNFRGEFGATRLLQETIK